MGRQLQLANGLAVTQGRPSAPSARARLMFPCPGRARPAGGLAWAGGGVSEEAAPINGQAREI
jgi:hypothetical protein